MIILEFVNMMHLFSILSKKTKIMDKYVSSCISIKHLMNKINIPANKNINLMILVWRSFDAKMEISIKLSSNRTVLRCRLWEMGQFVYFSFTVGLFSLWPKVLFKMYIRQDVGNPLRSWPQSPTPGLPVRLGVVHNTYLLSYVVWSQPNNSLVCWNNRLQRLWLVSQLVTTSTSSPNREREAVDPVCEHNARRNVEQPGRL